MRKINNKEDNKFTPQQLLIKYRQSLIALRIKKSMGELTQTHLIGQFKKKIARSLTKQNK